MLTALSDVVGMVLSVGAYVLVPAFLAVAIYGLAKEVRGRHA